MTSVAGGGVPGGRKKSVRRLPAAPAGGDGRLIVRDGSLVVNAEAGTVEVDGHITIAASGRVGALLKQLRAELLSLLAKKLEEPSLSLVGSPIYEAIVRLITSDGL